MRLLLLFQALLLQSFCQTTRGNANLVEADEVRRHLLEDNARPWEHIKRACRNSKFHLSMYVDTHIFLLAQRVTGDSSGCHQYGSVVFHSAQGGVKDAFEVTGHDDSFTNKPSLLLGSFRFEELTTAFEKAGEDRASAESYDVVRNNCATLVLNVLSALDILDEVGQDVVDFVSTQLVANQKTIPRPPYQPQSP